MPRNKKLTNRSRISIVEKEKFLTKEIISNKKRQNMTLMPLK